MIDQTRWIDRSLWQELRALALQPGLVWQLYLADLAEKRRTTGLGIYAPFLSTLVHVGLLGTVMSLVFQEPIVDFLPFFALSFSLWQAISAAVDHTGNANERAARLLAFPNISGQVQYVVDACEIAVALVFKLLAALVIISSVNVSVLAGINIPALLFGFALMILAMFCWTLPLAYLFDRVRLVQAFLPQILYAAFLLTPILWRPERLADHPWVYLANPLYHLVEAVRAPILGGTYPVLSWIVVSALALAGAGACLVAYRPNRSLMIYRWIA